MMTQDTPTMVVSNSPYMSGRARTTTEASAKARTTAATSSAASAGDRGGFTPPVLLAAGGRGPGPGHAPEERHLGGVPLVVEHRLAGEEAGDGQAVEPAGEGAVGVPGFDGMRPAQAVEADVGRPDLGRDPTARPGRVAAGVDHRLEV